MKTLIRVVLLFALCVPVFAQTISAAPEGKTIFENTKAATVIVLSGEGAGRLQSVATGVLISRDGVILTALHAIKGAAEVQVRTANGEVFDHVVLLGSDERRDVAALKISAGSLPSLIPGDSAKIAQGDRVYAVTNADGLTFSASEGILSALRPADEIPGAGTGFRLMQFTAPIAPGASGGALVDSSGALVGIITGKKGVAGFAVPIESVIELPHSGRTTPLGSGVALQMPDKLAASIPQSSAAVAGADSKQLLKNSRTVFLQSKTMFLTVDTVIRALMQQKNWPELGLTIVQDPRLADVQITIDHPLFTYIHTFVITDKKTSVVLGSGRQTAFDGTIASRGIAKDIVKIFAGAKFPPVAKQ